MTGAKQGLLLFQRTVESVGAKRLPSPWSLKFSPKCKIEGMDRLGRRLKNADFRDAHVEVRACFGDAAINDQMCTRPYDTRRISNIRFDLFARSVTRCAVSAVRN